MPIARQAAIQQREPGTHRRHAKQPDSPAAPDQRIRRDDAVDAGQHASVGQTRMQFAIQRGQIDAERRRIETRPGDIDERQPVSRVASAETPDFSDT